MPNEHPETVPQRIVVHGDALAWLAANTAPERAAVITSLPDVSELPLALDAWKRWFIATAATLMRWVPEDGIAMFFQSDVRVDGALVDKGYLVLRAAEEVGANVLFHKIVCRNPPGTVAYGRASYSHLIGVTRAPARIPRRPGPDVLADAGAMTWSRAMGLEACRLACRYLVENTNTRVVVDPFCGRGSVLAVANALGLDAIGVELGGKRCRAARALRIDVGAPTRAGDAAKHEDADPNAESAPRTPDDVPSDDLQSG